MLWNSFPGFGMGCSLQYNHAQCICFSTLGRCPKIVYITIFYTPFVLSLWGSVYNHVNPNQETANASHLPPSPHILLPSFLPSSPLPSFFHIFSPSHLPLLSLPVSIPKPIFKFLVSILSISFTRLRLQTKCLYTEIQIFLKIHIFHQTWRNWGEQFFSLPPAMLSHISCSLARYFINDNDQIRKISDPEAVFQYKINRNERFNIKQREALNGKIRQF